MLAITITITIAMAIQYSKIDENQLQVLEKVSRFGMDYDFRNNRTGLSSSFS